ncbi:hypothetical protein Vadar_002486 [Vaccinium darrowii]|uniref:Uncharacterized protein n=1 Tax=Vaccinium darrowii TaxID=229202 RepID=A0ACB7WXB2_9ERIC|nr:hypothetical protein Vadar_002486 [Vaccinium darrowii]
MALCCFSGRKQKHYNPRHSVTSRPQRSNLSELPRDIIIDILSRLDVKSLLRFRCVTKSWASLISDPQLVRTHMIHHSMKSHNIVLGINSRHRTGASCTLIHSIFNKPYFSEIKLNMIDRLLANRPGHSYDIGVLGVFGFGYDYSQNDYKVVFHCHERQGWFRAQTHIYSLKTNSWKCIDQTYRGGLGSEPSKCINGIVHWISKPWKEAVLPRRIVSFDLAEETYAEVPQPFYADGSWLWSFGVLEGSLCLVTDNSEYCSSVWIMKEYGVNESWTILYTFSYAETPGLYKKEVGGLAFSKSFNPPFPVSMSKKGEIVFEVGLDLVLYSDKDKTFARFPCKATCNMHPFGESFVSPNAYNGYDQEASNM